MLSKSARYAIRAMAYVASHQKDGAVKTCAIARETDVPPDFLVKVVNRLVQEGLLLSRRGAGGGLTLGRPADEIGVDQVFSLFVELDCEFDECFWGKATCDGPCSMHGVWAPAVRGMRRAIEGLTIESLVT